MALEAPQILLNYPSFKSKPRVLSSSPSRTPLLPVLAPNGTPQLPPKVAIMESAASMSLAALSFDPIRDPSPLPSTTDLAANPASPPDPNADVDPQIIEALRNKDRLFVLKMGEIMEGLITERRARADVAASTSYQRLLVHRCAAYYKCTPESDPVSKVLSITISAESRIPVRRIIDLVPMESQAQPAFKIMRRSSKERGKTKPRSHSSSVAGEDADLSDVEPSEAGSVGARSNATHSRKHMTIAEREAAYNEARSRIFMDFEEKEKEKEKDMSASSSTFSLVSGSTSGGGGSSIDDLEDSVSTAPTESEWSGPVNREKKGTAGSSASSSRSWRSNNHRGNGNGSCRGSRAPSPSFTYASIYEPTATPATLPYEAPDGQGPPAHGYILYAYPPPGPPPAAGYYPYPYYYPYPPPHPHSEPTSGHATPDVYGPQPHQMPPYGPAYAWGPIPPPGAPPMQPPSQSPPHPQPGSTHANPPPPPNAGPYPPPAPGWAPMPGPYGPYQGYYQQPVPFPSGPGQMPPPMPPYQVPAPRPFSPDMGPPRTMNGHGGHSRASSRSSSVSGSGNKRGAPAAVRSAWSYGPTSTIHPPYGMGGMVGDAVGPRLSSSMRRSSAASSIGSGSIGNRTPSDEASSVSSTNSSSSRRTFTSTSTSSKHPLPARPDWAINLKPQPTLHGVGRSRNGSNAMPPQSNDFPPLSAMSSTPKAPPVVGAWGKPAATKSILAAPGPVGNALVQYPAGSPELLNGKRRPGQGEEDALVERMAGVGIGGEGAKEGGVSA